VGTQHPLRHDVLCDVVCESDVDKENAELTELLIEEAMQRCAPCRNKCSTGTQLHPASPALVQAAPIPSRQQHSRYDKLSA
jgi:predicted anti-sigma-YlaC factor YlaD